ncbi:MAG: hypothetical protein ABSC41_16825, partial [Acidimicrobiales bacterium]
MSLGAACRRARGGLSRRVGTTLVFLLASAWTVTLAAPSAHAAAGPANAGPRTVTASSFKQTWSTGTLPDQGQPIALSSPIPADLDGQPAMVVGDRRGLLYAYHLSNGTRVARWPATNASGPIDSTPSIDPSTGLSTVLVGSGDDVDPTTGGYTAFGPSGGQKWFTPVVNPPSDAAPLIGVEAGISI